MGQAKQRGTREQRVNQAIERERAEHEARRSAEAKRLAALPPEQRKRESARRRRAQMLVTTMLGAVYGMDDLATLRNTGQSHSAAREYPA